MFIELREIKKEYHPTSDHQAMYWVHKHYQSMKNDSNFRVANSFCKQKHIRKEKLDSLAGNLFLIIFNFALVSKISILYYEYEKILQILVKYM